jgi:small subunit ribosomal protein S7
MRGKRAPKRDILPDEIYGSLVVSRLINRVMYDGKKSVARKAVYAAIAQLEESTKEKALRALDKAFSNVRPRVEIRSKRVGGANYQVPTPVREERQYALAMKWIIEAARSGRGNNDFAHSLARELIAAFKNEGTAVRKKEEVQRMADANQAFAQYA